MLQGNFLSIFRKVSILFDFPKVTIIPAMFVNRLTIVICPSEGQCQTHQQVAVTQYFASFSRAYRWRGCF